MSGNCELGRGLRRREKNATERGAGRFQKPAPDARAAPPEAPESLIGRKTVEEVPLTGLSFKQNPANNGQKGPSDRISSKPHGKHTQFSCPPHPEHIVPSHTPSRWRLMTSVGNPYNSGRSVMEALNGFGGSEESRLDELRTSAGMKSWMRRTGSEALAGKVASERNCQSRRHRPRTVAQGCPKARLIPPCNVPFPVLSPGFSFALFFTVGFFTVS
jgi:hypothetical protein